MKGVCRYDIGGLEKPVITPAGFLRVDGYLTRAGIFEYRNPDGSKRLEFRPHEEVFKADSLQSFALAPVTDDHPPANLTAENAREYQRGAVTENVHQDGDLMRGRMLITDADLRDQMMAGKKNQVSLGYTCDVEMTPGEWQGRRYDAVQKNIRGNHVAIVERGRAGAGARVRMDAADAGMVSDPPSGPAAHSQESTLATTNKTFRCDGLSFEAPENVAELVEKLMKERADAIGSVATVKADLQKKLDGLEAERDTLKTDLAKAKADAAEAPKKLRAEIAARMGLESKARGVLGKSHKFDAEATDRAIRVAVLSKLEPKTDVAAKSDAYVEAKFDMAMESVRRDSTEELEEVRRSAAGKGRKDADDEVDEEHLDGEERIDAAKERNAAAMRDEWKKPLGRHAARE